MRSDDPARSRSRPRACVPADPEHVRSRLRALAARGAISRGQLAALEQGIVSDADRAPQSDDGPAGPRADAGW